MTELNQIDLRALATGNKRAWDAFVAAAAPLINAVIRRTLASYRLSEEDVMDAAQDVRPAVRQRLPAAQDLRSGARRPVDLAGGGFRSSAVDHARRRRRQATTPIDDVPEACLAVEDRHVEKLKIPQGLLTERQILILKCLYDEERDVAEVAQLLKIDAQTVRSTHHKALLRLREHFRTRRHKAGMKPVIVA